MRQIVLDTETTGLEVEQGHRVIEIGCVEIVNRRPNGPTFHQYLNPGRDIDTGALEVHGIDSAFLADKPDFADIVDDFLAFVDGAQLIIHNAPFDIGFLDNELRLVRPDAGPLDERCSVLDTLLLARDRHPGQRNSLDALCKRYAIDNTNRTLHGALLDAQILADVYLTMTGGQASLSLAAEEADDGQPAAVVCRPVVRDGRTFVVQRASEAELAAHRARLERLDADSSSGCAWTELETQAADDS